MTDRLRWLLAVVVAVGAPGAVSVAFVPVRSRVPNASVALALAVVVVVVAASVTRLPGLLAALSAGLAFDVLFTKPYNSLAITRAQDVETTVLLVALGVTVGQLAARNRRHRRLAAEASYDLGRIHAVAEMVAAGASADQVVLAVANELRDLLSLRDCWFDRRFAETPGPFIESHGDVGWGRLRWGFRTMGLPAQEVTLVVAYRGLPLGRFVLLPRPGLPVTADRLVAAVALADQAGAALAAENSSAT
jgi:hypothetical protein